MYDSFCSHLRSQPELLFLYKKHASTLTLKASRHSVSAISVINFFLTQYTHVKIHKGSEKLIFLILSIFNILMISFKQ